jgi:AAA15 family ATPase/GTPase
LQFLGINSGNHPGNISLESRNDMLKNLLIQNYALIRHLEIMPAEGLNMITGETGAGKSIMIGAAGLLLGNRVDTRYCTIRMKNVSWKGFLISANMLYRSFLI